MNTDYDWTPAINDIRNNKNNPKKKEEKYILPTEEESQKFYNNLEQSGILLHKIKCDNKKYWWKFW